MRAKRESVLREATRVQVGTEARPLPLGSLSSVSLLIFFSKGFNAATAPSREGCSSAKSESRQGSLAAWRLGGFRLRGRCALNASSTNAKGLPGRRSTTSSRDNSVAPEHRGGARAIHEESGAFRGESRTSGRRGAVWFRSAKCRRRRRKPSATTGLRSLTTGHRPARRSRRSRRPTTRCSTTRISRPRCRPFRRRPPYHRPLFHAPRPVRFRTAERRSCRPRQSRRSKPSPQRWAACARRSRRPTTSRARRVCSPRPARSRSVVVTRRALRATTLPRTTRTRASGSRSKGSCACSNVGARSRTAES